MAKKETKFQETETLNSTIPETINVRYEEPIQPLALNLDLGRQDLNDNFRKVQEKINELIK